MKNPAGMSIPDHQLLLAIFMIKGEFRVLGYGIPGLLRARRCP
jgi:hypothetical protein